MRIGERICGPCILGEIIRHDPKGFPQHCRPHLQGDDRAIVKQFLGRRGWHLSRENLHESSFLGSEGLLQLRRQDAHRCLVPQAIPVRFEDHAAAC
jgi:hypothetical protein